MCTKGRTDTKYYLNLYESKGNITINDGEKIINISPLLFRLVMGACTFNYCEKDSLAAFDFFYIQSAQTQVNKFFV
jgi:hypothetical protein